MALLRQRVAEGGLLTLYSGSLGSSFATLVGHYPWFMTYNFLQGRVPQASSGVTKQIRSASLGFCSALVSDIVSNSVRVVKTAKQTGHHSASYSDVIREIIAKDGLQGLFFRGLSTKIISNGVQAMLFTVVWRYLAEIIERRQTARLKADDKSA